MLGLFLRSGAKKLFLIYKWENIKYWKKILKDEVLNIFSLQYFQFAIFSIRIIFNSQYSQFAIFSVCNILKILLQDIFNLNNSKYCCLSCIVSMMRSAYVWFKSTFFWSYIMWPQQDGSQLFGLFSFSTLVSISSRRSFQKWFQKFSYSWTPFVIRTFRESMVWKFWIPTKKVVINRK